MKIKELFTINQGIQITDEEIYYSNGKIPIITANNEIKGYGNKSIVKIEDLPCLTYPTKAFTGKIFVQDDLFSANNTAILILNKKYSQEINLKYISIFLSKILIKHLSSENAVNYIGKNVLKEIEIDYPFPTLKEQCKYVEKYEKILKIKKYIEEKITEIDKILESKIKFEKYRIYKMNQISLLNKGSNQISEKMIYENYDNNGIPIFSSSTLNNGLMGKVSYECYKNFHKKGNKKELTWVTNGYAGKVFYRDTDFLYTEKCGRIVIRNEYIEKILPKFLCYILNQITYSYKTSESNNGKLDIIHMENVLVPIPINSNDEIDIDIQKKIIKEYEKLEFLKEKLTSILKEIEL